ncbi:MAG TPA: guanylate kinase [Pyrinomonadaceae bacterium]|nr:guanylate kinase [Pyrinomonadaceae bacterium]
MSSETKELAGKVATATQSGILFVVSSPSGGGKGTLIQRVLSRLQNLSYSVSYTTRKPRNGEVHGREYFFVNREEFSQMVERNDFLEWATVHSHLYGTSRSQVAHDVALGRDIVLEVDVQGAASIRNLVHEAVSVFILPPSLKVLRERLIARGTDSEEELAVRLRNAPKELKAYKTFDYVIINDDVEQAAAKLMAIIEAERLRLSRQEEKVRGVVDSFQL